MDPTTATALYALSGVVLSILGSYFVARKTLNLEIKKLRSQILQIYSGELLRKRLDSYPKFYNCLSSFVKDIENQTVSKEILQKLNNDYSQLDSEYAIFFMENTIEQCINFRRRLKELNQLSEQDLSKTLSSSDEMRLLQDLIGKFELALKSEIGVYGFGKVNSDGDVRVNTPDYYDQINKSVTYVEDKTQKALPPSDRT